jgi:hypothetical protein
MSSHTSEPHTLYLGFAESDHDVDDLLHIARRKSLPADALTIVPLSQSAEQEAKKKGLRIDTDVVRDFGPQDLRSCLTEATEWTTDLVEGYAPDGFVGVAIHANIPRLNAVLFYVLCCYSLVHRIADTYPDADWLLLPHTPDPYVPVGPAPSNDPIRSGILRAILWNRNPRARSQSAWVSNSAIGAIRILLRGVRRFLRALLRGNCNGPCVEWHHEGDGGLESTPKASEAATHKRAAVYLLADFSRTFDINHFVQDPRNKDLIYISGSPEQAKALAKSAARHVKGVALGLIGELTVFLKAIALYFSLGAIERRFTHSLPFARLGPGRSSHKRLARLVFHARVWDVEALARQWVLWRTIVDQCELRVLAASDVDTIDARVALLTAKHAGLKTISWPHGYYFYERSKHLYTADALMVHGGIEHDFATMAGIDETRLFHSGRRFAAAARQEDPKCGVLAVVIASGTGWCSMPERWVDRAVDITLRAIGASNWKSVLKLHPMHGCFERWQRIQNDHNAPLDASVWSDARFAELDGAIFIGHPGSSLIAVAEASDVPAVVVPWSQDDCDLLEHYAFCVRDPEEAVATVLRAAQGDAIRVTLLQSLARFRDECITPGRRPEHVLAELLLG